MKIDCGYGVISETFDAGNGRTIEIISGELVALKQFHTLSETEKPKTVFIELDALPRFIEALRSLLPEAAN